MANSPTLRERIARLETLMENHVKHHEIRDAWFLRILGGLVVGIILIALPGCIRLLAGVI